MFDELTLAHLDTLQSRNASVFPPSTSGADYGELRATWESSEGSSLRQLSCKSCPIISTLEVYVFCSYSHKDEKLKEHLRKHLSPLIRAKEISEFWDFRKIPPGREVNQEIFSKLSQAHVILLLLSHNFFDSDYCWEMRPSSLLHNIGL